MEATEAVSLRAFTAALVRQGVSVSRPLRNWDDAIALLFSAITGQPRVAVVDEFPFLVLAAIADGNRTNGAIAGFVGRKSADITHPLNVLEDAALIAKEADVFRRGRWLYRVTEPLITFSEVVMRPEWYRLESGIVNDPANRTQTEIDVAVLAPPEPGLPRRLLSLGEVKWGQVMTSQHTARLARARDLLAGSFDVSDCTLACYSAAGFSADLCSAAGPGL